MKSVKSIYAALLLLTALFAMSCEKPAPIPQEQPIAVTYTTIEGCWQLTHLQGSPLINDTLLYIEFNRSDRSYTMWDNLNSMYPVKSTGSFAISQEEDGSYTLSGSYDYGVGAWSNHYRVTLSNEANSMKWLSLGGANEVMDFVRIDQIPELN